MEESTSALAGFYAGPLSCFFVERKTREPREKPLKQGENQQQTWPT